MYASEKCSATSRIDDIEVLRAVAIVLVVIHHLKLNLFHWKSESLWYFSDWFGSARGVTLFFVISGFVIARTLLPQLQAASGMRQFFHTATAFWIRRIWRIVPAAWTCIAVSLVLVLLFNESGALGTVKGNLIVGASALLNFANYTFGLLYGDSEYRNILFVHWSLSLEMQFYLLFPVVVLLCRRFLVPVLILATVVQLLAAGTVINGFRSDALFTGVLLAIWSTSGSYWRARTVLRRITPPGTAAVVLIYASLVVLGQDAMPFPRAHPLSLVVPVCALAVLIASCNLDVLVPSPGPRKVMLWIGSRSYSLYLWHIPAFALTRELFFRLGYRPLYAMSDPTVVIYTAMGIGLCLLLAEASYRLVEVPFRRQGRRIARNWNAGPPAASGEPGPAAHQG